MIEIEKHIPIPKRGARAEALPFLRLEVGDSFAIPVPPEEIHHPASFAAKIRNRAGSIARREGFEFLVRLIDENKRIRVWRKK